MATTNSGNEGIGPDQYFTTLEERLSGQGFEIRRPYQAGTYQLDIFAMKTKFELSKFGKMTRCILGMRTDSMDAAGVQNFAKVATKFVLDNWGRDRFNNLAMRPSHMILSVPLVVSNDFSDDVKNWLGKLVTEKYWTAVSFPALFSLKERKLYYSNHTPVWGAAYYGGFRTFVSGTLRF